MTPDQLREERFQGGGERSQDSASLLLLTAGNCFSNITQPNSQSTLIQFQDAISLRRAGPASFSRFKNTAVAHFWKPLDCHIHRGPICQLLECGSTETLACIRRIAECSPEYSGFSKYLTIPLKRIKSPPPVHLLIFRNVIISSGLIWNELFIQTD